MNITKIIAGITHLHRKNQVSNKANLIVPLFVTSFLAFSLPQNQPTNNEINRPPNGIVIKVVILSKVSNIPLPKMVNPDQSPNDMEAAIHIINRITLVTVTAFFLVIFFSSIR